MVGALLMLVVVAVGTAGAGWREATPAERQSYILGITDGLRMANGFDRAEVDLGPVAQCMQQLSADRLTGVVGDHLDAQAVESDEIVLPFHVWDALISTCLGPAAAPGTSG
jgi:hypothetical protein